MVKVIASALILILALYLIRGVIFVLDALSERSASHRLLYKRLVPVARLMLWLIALYVVTVGVLGIGAGQLIAAAAAIGVAVGFAAQDLLKNVFGGLVIIFDQPFQVGDKIEMNETYGEVVAIGLRSTRLVTPDDNLVSVPNAQVVEGQVSNANASELDCLVVTHLYLPHDTDERLAEQLAFEAATNSKYTFHQKPVQVIIEEILDQEPVLHLEVKAYVIDTRNEFLLMSDVTKRARRAFRAEGLLGSCDAPVDSPAASSSDAASETHSLLS